jgi:hypothetical protein
MKCYGVDLQLVPPEINACPGQTVTYDLKVINTGYYQDKYDITLSGMNIALKKNSTTLASGAEDSQSFNVAGSWCLRGEVPFTVKAVGHASDAEKGMLRIMEPGAQCADLEVSPEKTPAEIECSGQSYTFYVKNTGYTKQNVTLSLAAPEQYVLQPNTVSLYPSEVKQVAVYLVPSAATPSEPYMISVIADNGYKKAYMELEVDLEGPVCMVKRPILETSVPEPVLPMIIDEPVTTGNETPAQPQTPTGAAVGGDNTGLFALVGVLVITAVLLLLLIVTSGRGKGSNWDFPEVKGGSAKSDAERMTAIKEAISQSSK